LYDIEVDVKYATGDQERPGIAWTTTDQMIRLFLCSL
jgi:hypothetical protein